MSVIVKGMEMPKNCKECPFSDHEAWCLLPGDWRERYYCPDDERSDDCPLIELPPHGRLGDLDALQKQVENTIQDAHMSLLWKQGMMYAGGLVEVSKTVIEAEGSET